MLGIKSAHHGILGNMAAKKKTAAMQVLDDAAAGNDLDFKNSQELQLVKCHCCMHFHQHLDVKWVLCGCLWEDGCHLECYSYLIFRRAGNLSKFLRRLTVLKRAALQGVNQIIPVFSDKFVVSFAAIKQAVVKKRL